jgi:CheY-like chemotaxis protein
MTADADQLVVAVSDTGPGIEAEHLELIFEAFRQTEAGAAAGGSGLGLTISQRLVRAIGGRLAVTSVVGAGSTFWFSVPLVTATEAPVGGARDETPGAVARLAPGMRVRALVVDDNAVSRQVLASLLESAGVEAITASSGREALEQARRSQPDVIFMDRRMPGIDGLDATRRLRADPDTAHIPVVAISASAFSDSPEAAREAGCVDFLAKPVRAELLYAALQRHLAVTFVPVAPAVRAPLPAAVIEIPADAPAIGRKLRAAAEIGDVVAIGGIAEALRSTGASELARQIADLNVALDFDALVQLASWLDRQVN